MPELPEIETIVLALKDLIVGRRIQEVTWDWPKSFPGLEPARQALLGQVITGVERRAKMIFIHLSSGDLLHIHLKMTGQLVYQPATREPLKSTRVIFQLDDGMALFFNDTRKFGWINLINKEDLNQLTSIRRLGPEPLKVGFTAKILEKQLSRRPNTSIKAALLDQSVVAGLGNIYCDEALFLAGILPDRHVNSLSQAEVKSLHRSIRRVLKDSISLGGSTRRDYRNAKGEIGHYLDHAWVYNRQGQACRKCGQTIQKIRVAQRGTHFCPHCQV